MLYQVVLSNWWELLFDADLSQAEGLLKNIC